VATLGPSTTLLVDTFDVEEGVRRAIEVGGPSLGAVRIDSGDLGAQSRRVRALLDEHGLNSTRIVATSDLDEHRVAALAAAPVDAYGVGTRLVTGCGAPTAELVYKLVARESASGEMVGVVKRSQRKASHPGRKYASRVRADGTATREIVYVGEGRPELDVTERDLMVTMMQRGEREWRDDLGAARRRHAASRAELPGADRDLSPGRPSLTTEYRSI
jgi:nicotinate phosphoribosyltransferase